MFCRRHLILAAVVLGSSALCAAEPSPALCVAELDRLGDSWQPVCVNLIPAKWIWLPSQRTLPNTFVLFRREIDLTEAPRHAQAWITADSRYLLTVNGRRVQWGPAPCDPRQLDVDAVDLTSHLHAGKNVIGVEVLFYGIGEGTWAGGKPGMIFHATFESADGMKRDLVSDESWQARLDRAHRPGQYKRWFLRTLQEEFDARLHPYGWDTPDAKLDDDWVSAQVLGCKPFLPPSCSDYNGNDSIDRADPSKCALRKRQIPAMRETEVSALRLADAGRINWLRDPADWFEFRMPDSFRITREPLAEAIPEGGWSLPATSTARQGLFATFEFQEQMVGWPYFTIDAPAGTIVELMTQESHAPNGPAWLDTHYFGWSRFVCREGLNRFEAFDFESFRWLQLHVRNASRPVIISNVGIRRRVFPWPTELRLTCSEPALQRVFNAALNTLRNSAQETCVDGMARERQQYSGDGGHQLQALYYGFGDTRQAARFLRTFSEGMTPEGYFLDCWPGYDRLARVMQKQMDGASWGPILDHGVGFNFDCWNYWMQTGDLEALREPYPRLLRFATYLASLRGSDGLLPVENLGIPTVWMDHDAYRKTRHRQCAFNLYTAAMLQHALAPIAKAFGDDDRAREASRLGEEIQQAAAQKFWSAERGLFVDNLPWLDEERQPRLSDRALANAILFDQCPGGKTAAAVRALVECPAEMGLSYPCNATWRYWALAKAGRTDVILGDFRRRFATMTSVIENNSIQETWHAPYDSTSQWSHAAVSPIDLTMSDIAGICPITPGFARYEVRPQPADIGRLELTAHTAIGPFKFLAEPVAGGHKITLSVPSKGEGELLLPPGSQCDLPPLMPDHPLGLTRFRLQPGATCVFRIKRAS